MGKISIVLIYYWTPLLTLTVIPSPDLILWIQFSDSLFRITMLKDALVTQLSSAELTAAVSSNQSLYADAGQREVLFVERVSAKCAQIMVWTGLIGVETRGCCKCGNPCLCLSTPRVCGVDRSCCDTRGVRPVCGHRRLHKVLGNGIKVCTHKCKTASKYYF